MRMDKGIIYYPPDVPVFYWADPHFDHANILLYCGRKDFMSPAERELYDAWVADGSPRHARPRISRESVVRMNDSQIASVNRFVPHDGILVLAGDFIFGTRGAEEYFESAKRFRGAIQCRTIHMVWGNHDSRHIAPLFRWAHEKITIVIRVGGVKHTVVVNHEDIGHWNKRSHGSRHYYGHSHANIEDDLDRIYPGRLSQDIGTDNAYRLTGEYRPFSDLELEAKFAR